MFNINFDLKIRSDENACMPQGFTNAVPVFQQVVAGALLDFITPTCYVLIDDIPSKSLRFCNQYLYLINIYPGVNTNHREDEEMQQGSLYRHYLAPTTEETD
jgi:hypothetical protein